MSNSNGSLAFLESLPVAKARNRSPNRAQREALAIARQMRAAGYPDAVAAPEYCIEEIGSDNFYTYTISVYAGEYVAPKPLVLPGTRLLSTIRRFLLGFLVRNRPTLG